MARKMLKGGVAQLNERDVGQPDVDGLALHVEADGMQSVEAHCAKS